MIIGRGGGVEPKVIIERDRRVHERLKMSDMIFEHTFYDSNSLNDIVEGQLLSERISFS